MLLAEFRALLIHFPTRRDVDNDSRRYRTIAIPRRRTSISSHRELQEQQRAQAKPCDIFPTRATHKGMITRALSRLPTRRCKRGNLAGDGLIRGIIFRGPPVAPIQLRIVNVFSGNNKKGLPGLYSLYCMFDAEHGTPIALLDGNGGRNGDVGSGGGDRGSHST
jgi:hypothetical protein